MDKKLKAENLEKLKLSGILKNFVRSNKGLWDHLAWLKLCEKIKKEGCYPIDLCEVGQHLEKIKARYHHDNGL